MDCDFRSININIMDTDDVDMFELSRSPVLWRSRFCSSRNNDIIVESVLIVAILIKRGKYVEMHWMQTLGKEF